MDETYLKGELMFSEHTQKQKDWVSWAPSRLVSKFSEDNIREQQLGGGAREGEPKVPTHDNFIPQIEPWIDDEELNELTDVIKSTFVTEHKKTEEFEQLFAQYTGSKHAIAYSNGTMALFAALHVLDIGEGDEVIVPDLTFAATANAVILAGAKPVFADIDPETLQITAELVAEKITPQTKAIIPVHLYGGAVQMNELLVLAKEHDLHIIEDAAQGVGVKLGGKHVGTFGDMGILSFYGNKTMTTGEGGLILTDSEEHAKKVFTFKNHGRPIKGVFIHDEIGYNFSMSDLNSAIGISQFKKLPKIIARKKEIYNFYQKNLKNVQIYEYPENVDPVQWFTSIKVEDPEEFSKYMKQQNIGTRRFFYPLHLQPCYKDKGFAEGQFLGTEDAYNHGISLPSSVTLTEEQLTYISTKANDYFKDKTRLHRDVSTGANSSVSSTRTVNN